MHRQRPPLQRRPWPVQALAWAWAAPNTALGLLLALPALLLGARLRRHGPTLEVALSPGPVPRGHWLHHLPFEAITFGHLVLGLGPRQLRRLRAHERVHVRQYERWGPLFLPAYLLASTWALARGGSAYRDNPFERQAWRQGGPWR